MTLIQAHEQYAIVTDSNYGPIFGGGHDIVIGDGCNYAANSSACFPTSYNCDSKYYNNQESYADFSGATSGCNFKVIEYEVFQVVK
jgi:hypothetical protein